MTAIVSPTPMADMPPAPQPTDTEAEFDSKAFAQSAALQPFVTGANALANNVFDNATAADERAVAADLSAGEAADSATDAETAQGLAETAAGTATTAAGTATTQAGIATTAAGTATTQAGIATTQAGLAATAKTDAETAQGLAEDARDAAEGFRDQAEIFATQQLVGSSTTSLTPGAGTKVFTMEPGRAFVAGMYLVATSEATSSAFMQGVVSDYNSTTGGLTLAVDTFGGTGSHADWQIGVAAMGEGGMTLLTISADDTAIDGVFYIVDTPGVTLTIPSGWPDKARLGGRNISGGICYIDWGSNLLAGEDFTEPMSWPDKRAFNAQTNGVTFV